MVISALLCNGVRYEVSASIKRFRDEKNIQITAKDVLSGARHSLTVHPPAAAGYAKTAVLSDAANSSQMTRNPCHNSSGEKRKARTESAGHRYAV
jgi:hypothetical protein